MVIMQPTPIPVGARTDVGPIDATDPHHRPPAEQRSALQWANRLKRLFQIYVEACPNCGGTVKVIAGIEEFLYSRYSWTAFPWRIMMSQILSFKQSPQSVHQALTGNPSVPRRKS